MPGCSTKPLLSRRSRAWAASGSAAKEARPKRMLTFLMFLKVETSAGVKSDRQVFKKQEIKINERL